MAEVAAELDATMMPYTLMSPVMYNQSTPGAAYASSLTLTDVSTNPQYVLPPGSITLPGQTLHLFAAGVYGDTGTPTLITGFYINTQTTAGGTGVGGQALAATTTVTGGSSQTNLPWVIEAYATFTAVGSSGTVLAYGWAMLGLTTTTQTISLIPFTTPQTALTVDTTKGQILSVGAKWSATSASNTLTCNVFTVDIRN